MADLKKYPNDLPLSKKQVKTLAKKFSPVETYHNIHHREMWTHDLLGEDVPMERKTLIGGGVEINSPNGEKGLFFDERPEEKAFRRWKVGDFEAFEHELADRWRDSIREIDLQYIVQTFKKLRSKENRRIRNQEELAHAVNEACKGIGRQYRLLCSVIDDLEPGNTRLRKMALNQWKATGKLPIKKFAPYALYCHAMNLFFCIGIGEGLLSTRATNLIDLQYLYYLPFCKVFVSGDKFHSQIVPLFLQPGQIFVDSKELKADLKIIADMWDATDRTSGTENFIDSPPRGKGLISEKIWDHCVPNWREWADAPPIQRSPESDAKAMKKIRPMMKAIDEYQKRKRTGSD